MTPEGKVKKKVKEVLKRLDAYYVMPVSGGYGNSGVPDFLVCFRGKFVGIECKANGGTPTALQQQHLTDIRESGGGAIVINEDNVEQLASILLAY